MTRQEYVHKLLTMDVGDLLIAYETAGEEALTSEDPSRARGNRLIAALIDCLGMYLYPTVWEVMKDSE